MSKALRLSEKWFHRGLWVVAVVFANFLIGLGATLVGDLPKVEKRLVVEDFIDAKALLEVRTALQKAESAEQMAGRELDQTRLKQGAARAESAAARETFNNWLATRQVTQLPDQDAELLAKTHALDVLKDQERAAGAAVQAQQQLALDARQTLAGERDKLAQLEKAGQKLLDSEQRRVELRVFLYRLALTLPLLVLAGWLFVKKRQSTYWPFVWGFIIFAVFTFFVELVPYLPSYGGYVRYGVGIVVTVLVGRQAIVSLNRYLEKQRLVEKLPDAQRREELSYDTALTRLSKEVCPGCERAVNLKNTGVDFCPHCGIGLFNHCTICTTRKSAFAKFCQACGSTAERGATPSVAPAAAAPGLSPSTLP